MDINQKIKDFQASHPHVPESDIVDLVKSVATNCMEQIVANVELNGRGEGAWWSIQEGYDVRVLDNYLCLPSNRTVAKDIQKAFNNACLNEDIEGIKEGLRNFPEINHDGSLDPSSNILTDVTTLGNLKALKFFIEDNFINNHAFFKSQIAFEQRKNQLFEVAYTFQRIEILRYLILEHNLEFTPEARKMLKEDKTDFKNEVLSMIENKHLNYMLDLTLQSKTEVKSKNKI